MRGCVEERRFKVPGIQSGAGGFHISGRHAGGQGEQAVHGLALGRSEHVVDARHPQHVGDLVGVGHHGGGAVRAPRHARIQ